MRVRKLLSVVLAFVMVLGLLPISALAVEYSDANEAAWAAEAIDRWSSYGVVGGADGKFRPNANMTRAEAATVFANLLGLTGTEGAASFADVTADKWYYSAIQKANAAGIINGSYGYMNPDSPVTREMFFTMFARALGFKPQDTTSGAKADGASWSAGYINALTDKGYVGGYDTDGDGVLEVNATANINRASVMSLLNQTISTYANENGKTYEGTGKGVMLVTADDCTITGTIDTLVIAGDSEDEAVAKAAASEDGPITATLVLAASKKAIKIENATINNVNVVAPATVSVGEGTTIETVAVTEQAEEVTVEVAEGAKVETVETEAPATEISGSGEVANVAATGAAAAEDAKVEVSTPNTEVKAVATAENADGSKTVTITESKNDAQGASTGSTKTETTVKETVAADGTKTTTETVAETKTNAAGVVTSTTSSTTTTTVTEVTAADGTVTTTEAVAKSETDANGRTTTTSTTTTTATATDGSKTETVATTDANGRTTTTTTTTAADGTTSGGNTSGSNTGGGAAPATTTTTTVGVTTVYTVSFDLQGLEVSNASEFVNQTITAGGKVTEPANPVAVASTGHTFGGWYVGDTRYDFNSAVTGSMTLTAKWTGLTKTDAIIELRSTVAGEGLMVGENVEMYVDGHKVTSLVYDESSNPYGPVIKNSSETSLTFADKATTAISGAGLSLTSGTGAITGDFDAAGSAGSFTLTATGGTTNSVVELTITYGVIGENPKLSDLTVKTGETSNPATGATLVPTFNKDVTAYTIAAVENSVKYIKITGTSAGNVISVNGEDNDGVLALAEGANTFNVVVTTPNGATKTYTVSVTRNAVPAASDARLKSLTTSAGDITPAFDKDVTSYTLNVPYDTESITVTPTVNASGATVKAGLSGSTAAVASGSASGAIALSQGSNSVVVEVTASGSGTKSYTITVTRTASGTSVAPKTAVVSGGNATLTVELSAAPASGDKIYIYDSAGSVLKQTYNIANNNTTQTIALNSDAKSVTATDNVQVSYQSGSDAQSAKITSTGQVDAPTATYSGAVALIEDVDAATLNAAARTITVTLSGGTFASALDKSQFTLTGLPSAVEIDTVTRTGSTTAQITLKGVPAESAGSASSLSAVKIAATAFAEAPSGEVTASASSFSIVVTASHTVTFNLNGGDGTAPAAQTVADKGAATKPDDPTRANYTFAGWYIAAQKSAFESDPSSGTSFAWTTYTNDDNNNYIDGDLTLYACWTANTYNIAYEGTPDGYSSSAATYTFNTESQTVSPTKPEIAGKAFTGWTSATNGVSYNASNGQVTIPANATGTITLTATWGDVTAAASDFASSGTPKALVTVEGASAVNAAFTMKVTLTGATFEASSENTCKAFTFSGLDADTKLGVTSYSLDGTGSVATLTIGLQNNESKVAADCAQEATALGTVSIGEAAIKDYTGDPIVATGNVTATVKILPATLLSDLTIDGTVKSNLDFSTLEAGATENNVITVAAGTTNLKLAFAHDDAVTLTVTKSNSYGSDGNGITTNVAVASKKTEDINVSSTAYVKIVATCAAPSTTKTYILKFTVAEAGKNSVAFNTFTVADNSGTSEFSPAFSYAEATTTYDLTAPYALTTAKLTLVITDVTSGGTPTVTVKDAGGTSAITPSSDGNQRTWSTTSTLAQGSNEIVVTVTSEDVSTSKTYTINITRSANADATLASGEFADTGSLVGKMAVADTQAALNLSGQAVNAVTLTASSDVQDAGKNVFTPTVEEEDAVEIEIHKLAASANYKTATLDADNLWTIGTNELSEINDGDVFIIKVTAASGATKFYAFSVKGPTYAITESEHNSETITVQFMDSGWKQITKAAAGDTFQVFIGNAAVGWVPTFAKITAGDNVDRLAFAEGEGGWVTGKYTMTAAPTTVEVVYGQTTGIAGDVTIVNEASAVDADWLKYTATNGVYYLTKAPTWINDYGVAQDDLFIRFLSKGADVANTGKDSTPYDATNYKLTITKGSGENKVTVYEETKSLSSDAWAAFYFRYRVSENPTSGVVSNAGTGGTIGSESAAAGNSLTAGTYDFKITTGSEETLKTWLAGSFTLPSTIVGTNVLEVPSES